MFGKGAGADGQVGRPEETVGEKRRREALVAVRRMRTRSEAALVYAAGADRTTLEALLADAQEAEEKLVGA